MLHALVHRIRLRLWQRQARMLERDCRPAGTSEGDWIGANVAASAAGSGAGSQAGAQFGFAACDGGGVSYADGGSCGAAGGHPGGGP